MQEDQEILFNRSVLFILLVIIQFYFILTGLISLLLHFVLPGARRLGVTHLILHEEDMWHFSTSQYIAVLIGIRKYPRTHTMKAVCIQYKAILFILMYVGYHNITL